MNRTLALMIVAMAGLAIAVPTHADLQTDLAVVLQDKLLTKAAVGIEIAELGPEPADDRVLYTRAAQSPLMPASNMKLLTTSAALALLGPDFRFRTYLVQRADDLVLVGDGDPSFGDAELLKKAGWDATTVFQNWAQQLSKAAIVRFRDVLVDDSVFDETFVHPDWPPEQEQSRYMAQAAGMSLNANCIDFYLQPNGLGRVVTYRTDPPTSFVKVQNTCVSGGPNAVWLSRQRGGNQITLRGSCPARSKGPVSVTIHDPPMYAATVLAETLAAGGIRIDGKVARDRTVRATLIHGQPEPGITVLAAHETPLALVITRANKDSMNLYAESLLQRVGFAATAQSGSWDNGAAALLAFLKKLGLPPDECRVADGCGLSRQNALSAHAIIQVLSYDFHSKHRMAFINSLAVGGEDGTLDSRFKQPDLRGKVYAKTGYIANVSALSGYLKISDDQWYAFSILMNGLPAGQNARAKSLQDDIVKAIYANATRKNR